jgi:thiol-disulfide isomerase/thioredoxin
MKRRCTVLPVLALILAASSHALVAPPDSTPAGSSATTANAADDAAARPKIRSAREAIKAARSFGAVAITTGDWSKHGGSVTGGRYNFSALRADAGGWMIRVFVDSRDDQTPAVNVAFDGVTARSLAAADKVVHEMTPADAEETRGFFVSRSAAAPVPWDLLAGLEFPENAEFRLTGREKVADVDCELIRVAVPDESETLTIALGVEDHLPRRFEWRSDRASRTLTLTDLRLNQALPPSAFVVNAPPDYVVRPMPSPSRQARREQGVGPAEPQRPAPPARPGELVVGKPVPAFSLKDPEGNTVSLESLRGSVVLLDFWATWCGPCKAAMPTLQEFHKTYESKGLKVVGINAFERGDPVKYKKDQGYTYTLLLKGDGVATAFGVSGIPAFFLIDREGNLAWKSTGWGPRSKEPMKKAIEDALARGGGN